MSYSDPSKKPASGTSHFNESDPRNINPKTSQAGARREADHAEIAAQYGRSARAKHRDAASFDAVAEMLAKDWAAEHGNSGTTWQQVRSAVEDAWNRSDEKSADTIAAKGEFKSPPTFLNDGTRTPRNIDEPNR
ncbi:MAG: hypothetical protein H7144_06885 [Burkholderiales bacterium]|nr:hypothetical protein [Phycisphaerae bacterium]